MFNLATKHNDPEAGLGWGERVGYGANGFGLNAINGIIGSFLTIYMTNVALLDAGIIATIIAVSKIFDGVSDLIVGRMVDNTKSSLGKARVWLLRMCIPFAVSVLLLFYVPQGFPEFVKYIYVFLMYNIVNTICLTSLFVPFFSLISLVTKNQYERGFLGNVQQIFQTLGNVVVNSTFVVLLTKFTDGGENIYTQRAFTLTMLIFCIIMVIAALITVVFTKERVTEAGSNEQSGESLGRKASLIDTVKALLTNKYWVILTVAMFVVFFVIIFYAIGAVYYAQYIFADMGAYSWMANSISISQFAIMFAAPLLMKKIAKHNVYIMGLFLMTIGFLGFGLTSGMNNVPVMIICNVLKGCGLGLSGGMALGMVADTLTYGTLKTGIDTVGMGNAGVSAAQKLGLGLGTAVFGWALSWAGFDGALDAQGLPQPELVLTTVKFVYNWIPFAMCLLMFIVFVLFYRGIDRDLEALKAKSE